MNSLPKVVEKIITTYKEDLEEVDDMWDILKELNLEWFPQDWIDNGADEDDVWFMVQTQIESEFTENDMENIIQHYGGRHKIITYIITTFDSDVLTGKECEEELNQTFCEYILVSYIHTYWEDMVNCKIIEEY